MIIEIGYSYQLDKHSPTENGWTYFYVKGDDLEKSKKKAKLYWNKFIKELGWTKKAKLIHIEEIQNGKSYTPDFIVVSSSELPAARSKPSGTPLPRVLPSSRTRSTKRSNSKTSPRKSNNRVQGK
jgi:hypothetical protein